ncbi:unnamed protein product [Cyprideis torosa]|uniref:Phospholipase A2-like central domain-containing protein n=1 Tax=Cyprideis torosa TaxID=163714 RepID=A0A7R8WU19_9CRUS|nr:unnamed protein product [Cyprideis torosa]CAG0910020.1 unnamed protein product [Cyprideis torosa]
MADYEGRETTKTRPEVSPEFVYWHEQTFAVVQEASNGTVILCRLIEAIRPHEITAERRRLADLKYLIVKLTFSQMMDLMNRCRILNEEFIQPEEKVDEVILEYYPILDIDSDELLPELPPPMAKGKEERRNARSLMYSLTRGNVIPGTKWCGSGDVAEQYFDLGEDAMLDSCCRDHDHCPVKIRAHEQQYGHMNRAFYAKSHCQCDYAFLRCLRSVGTTKAELMGMAFANVFRFPCLLHQGCNDHLQKVEECSMTQSDVYVYERRGVLTYPPPESDKL